MLDMVVDFDDSSYRMDGHVQERTFMDVGPQPLRSPIISMDTIYVDVEERCTIDAEVHVVDVVS